MSVLSRFRRITTSGEYIAEVDGLRFLAIAGVLVTHFFGNYIGVMNLEVPRGGEVPSGTVDALLGGLADVPIARSVGEHIAYMMAGAGRGVELFFVISGFILGLPFARQHAFGGRTVRLKSYFTRRLTRLEPPYIIVVLAYGLLFIALEARSGGDAVSDIVNSTLASLLYIHYFVFGESNPTNSPLWSLEVEVQFYILAPILGLLFRLKYRIFSIVIVVILCIFLQDAFGFTKYSLLGSIQYFLIGFILSDLYLRGMRRVIGDGIGFAVGLVLLVVIYSIPFRSGGVVSPLLFAGSVFAFYYLVFTNKYWLAVFRVPVLAIIGGMCYSIYLIHRPLMTMLSRGYTSLGGFDLGPPWLSFTLGGLLISGIVIAISALFFLLIEKPCMRKDWPQRLWGWGQRRRSPKPVS